MIVVAILGLVFAIAVPSFIRSRHSSRMTACINNLRQIDSAIQSWALEQKKGPNQAVSYDDIRVFLKNSVICPAGGTSFDDSYELATVATVPLCKKVSDGEYAHRL